MKKSVNFILAALLFLIPASAFANAFFIQEMSGDGMAQGGAVIAAGTKPSNVFQNAANLSFIEGLHFEAVSTIYIPTGYFEDPQGNRTNIVDDPIVTPHFFASFKINDWLAVGMAEFIDFGLEIKWPKGWYGDHIVRQAGLSSVTLNPNISFGPFKGFAVAVGFDAKYGQISIKRGLTSGSDFYGTDPLDNQLHLLGDTWGFGANIGVMYQPAKWVRMGASYRSGIKMKLDNGKADFDVSPSIAWMFPDQNFKSELTLPHLVNAGARFWILDNLSLELDVWGTLWSSYNKLTFKFEEGLKQDRNPENNIYEQTETKHYRDFIQVRLGGEWWFHEHFAMRLGIMLDGDVTDEKYLDPMLPDGHRINSCIGFGTEWYGFYADVAYMLVYLLPRDLTGVESNPLPGKYTMATHDVTISIGYHFDPFFRDQQKAPEEENAPQEEQLPPESEDPNMQTEPAAQAS